MLSTGSSKEPFKVMEQQTNKHKQTNKQTKLFADMAT